MIQAGLAPALVLCWSLLSFITRITRVAVAGFAFLYRRKLICGSPFRPPCLSVISYRPQLRPSPYCLIASLIVPPLYHLSGNRESNPTLWLECQRSTDELFPQMPMLSNHRLLGKSGSIPSNAIDGWLIILGYRRYFLLFHIHIKRFHVHAHHSNMRNIQNLTQCNLYKFYVLHQKLRYQNLLHL